MVQPRMSHANLEPMLAALPEDKIVLWRDGRPVAVSKLLRCASSLAEQLPDGAYVANYCSDRFNFFVAVFAALMRDQVTCLPNDKTVNTQNDLMDTYPDLYCLADWDVGGDIIDLREFDLTRQSLKYPPDALTIEPEKEFLRVFTSGTTGRSTAHPKSWNFLRATSKFIADSIARKTGAVGSIVATVPSQHMYGLETAFMLPFVSDGEVSAAHPFYPSDICASLEAVPEPRSLVTTPIHLKTLLKSGLALPKISAIVSATDNLSPDLAKKLEASTQACVVEIFGCSEAGSLAVRYPTEDEVWQVIDGASLRKDGEVCVLTGGHLPDPVELSDVFDLVSQSKFKLMGRLTDMINVAGNRTSLSGLNAILCDVPGVTEGVFHLPASSNPDEITRLVALVVAPELDASQIRARLRESVDPVFLPRQIFHVPALPRNAMGKVSLSAVAETVRAFTAGARPEEVTGEMTIAADHPALDGHFPGDPTVPGAVLLDEAIAVVEKLCGRRVSGVSQAKFVSALRGGETVIVQVKTGAEGALRLSCTANGHSILTAVLASDESASAQW